MRQQKKRTAELARQGFLTSQKLLDRKRIASFVSAPIGLVYPLLCVDEFWSLPAFHATKTIPAVVRFQQSELAHCAPQLQLSASELGKTEAIFLF